MPESAPPEQRPKLVSVAMRRFFVHAARYRNASREVAVYCWATPHLYYIAAGFLVGGGIALALPWYPVAELLFAIGIGLFVAKGIHSNWKKEVGKQIAVIFFALGVLFIGGEILLIEWKRPATTNANIDTVLESQRHTDEKIDEILKGMGENTSRERLLKKYPLGYVVFELSYKNEVFPYARELLNEYDIEWSDVRFTKITADAIELRLPDLRNKNGTGIAITNLLVGGPKVVGSLGGAISDDLMELGEILAIKETGIVFLVGFRRKSAKTQTNTD